MPGDNEWTDCHRTNNGSYNSLERLNAIRKGLFNTAESFGKRKLTLDHQGPLGGVYAENTRWVYNGVVFVGLNVPGSNNDKVNPGACEAANTTRGQHECDANNLEFVMRDAANIAWLRRSFQLARQIGAPGIMITIQANMGFDIPETLVNELTDVLYRARPTPDALDGFDAFIKVLADETKRLQGPGSAGAWRYARLPDRQELPRPVARHSELHASRDVRQRQPALGESDRSTRRRATSSASSR